MTFRPTPVQRPRIPVWVVGAWPHERSMRRAAGGTASFVQAQGPDGGPATGPEVLPPIVDWVRRERPAELRDRPVRHRGRRRDAGRGPGAAATAVAEAHEAAGATWWIESDWSATTVEALRARIAAGPPRA